MQGHWAWRLPQESDLISLQLLTVTLSSIIFMANGTTSEFSSLYSAISSRSSRFTTVPHQVRSGWVVLHRLPQAPYTQPPTVSAKLHQHTEPEMSPSCTAGRRGVRPHAASGQRHQSVLAYRAARAAYEDKLLPCYRRADVCLHLRLLYPLLPTPRFLCSPSVDGHPAPGSCQPDGAAADVREGNRLARQPGAGALKDHPKRDTRYPVCQAAHTFIYAVNMPIQLLNRNIYRLEGRAILATA